MTTSDELVLGIDGGGTKTEAWLAAARPAGDMTVLGRGTASASNPQAVGFASATEHLARAVAAAFGDAGRTPEPVAAAVLALAGSDRESSRRELVAWAQAHGLARTLRVVHDALPVLVAGSGSDWGIALVSGTGSLAYGRDRAGREGRAGGWGFLFGDEGSGYAIGLAGLRAAAHALDGRGPATRLVSAVLAQLDARGPQGLVPAVYQAKDQRATVAALARVVTAAADDGDQVSRCILAAAAADLARMVAAVTEKLHLARRPFPLNLAGSTLLGSDRLKTALVDQIAVAGLMAEPIAEVPEPVRGTVLLAQKEVAG